MFAAALQEYQEDEVKLDILKIGPGNGHFQGLVNQFRKCRDRRISFRLHASMNLS